MNKCTAVELNYAPRDILALDNFLRKESLMNEIMAHLRMNSL